MRLISMNVTRTAGAVLLAGAIGTLLACAASAQPARTAPQLARTPQATSMPRYYVTTTGQGQAAVLDVWSSATGALTGTVHVPGLPVGSTVAASADGRSFVVGTVSAAGATRLSTYRLFRVHVSGTGVPSQPAPVAGIAIPLGAGPLGAIPLGAGPSGHGSVVGIALSPDGARIAVSVEYFAPSVDTFNPSAAIEVIDLATGKVRTWSGSPAGYWAGPPSWAGPATVAFAWWRVTFRVFPRVAQHVAGIGSVSTTGAGTSLPGTLVPLSTALGIRSVAFAPGSPQGVAIACLNHPGNGGVTADLGRLSLPSGQFRVISTETAAVGQSQSGLLARCGSVISVDPSGRHALVYGLVFGRLDLNAGSFTALPGFSPSGGAVAAAW